MSDSPGLAEKHGVPASTKVMQYDFVLVTGEEANRLRHQLALKVLEKQGAPGITVVNGMLVPNVD